MATMRLPTSCWCAAGAAVTSGGLGEVLRAAWGESHLGLVLTRVRELRLYVAVLGWWAVLLAVLVAPAVDSAHRGLLLHCGRYPSC